MEATTKAIADPLHFATRRRPALRPSGISARLVATTADFAVYLLACPVTLGASAIILRGYWPIGAAAIAVLALALFWSEGQSPGMRLAGIRVVRGRDGRNPGFGRGLVRALFAVPPVAAAFVLVNARLDPQFSSTTLEYAAIAVLALGAVCQLWAIFDRTHLPLHDRLAGVVTHDERTGPWPRLVASLAAQRPLPGVRGIPARAIRTVAHASLR